MLSTVRITFFVIFLFYVVVSAFFYFEVNPDLISYISIGQYYHAGQWDLAINSYWSPLFSWLIAIGLYIPLSPLIIAKLWIVLFQLIGLILLYKLIGRLELSVEAGNFTMICCSIFWLHITCVCATPDSIQLAFLLAYLLIVTAPKYWTALKWSLPTAFLVSLGYFAKSFTLPFFLIHYPLAFLLKGKQSENSKSTTTFILTLLLTFVFIAPWTIILYNKYGRLIFSDSGSYNHALVGLNTIKEHPIKYLGLLKPWHDKAVSIWETPNLQPYMDWSPFSSFVNFKHQIVLILENSLRIVFKAFKVSAFLFATPFWGLYLLLRKRASKVQNFFLLTSILYALGYSPILLEDRYLIFPFTIWTALVFSYVQQAGIFKKSFKTSMIVGSVMILSFLPKAYRNFSENLVMDKALYSYHQSHTNINIPPHTSVFSNKDWTAGLFFSYYFDLQYYGVPALNKSLTETMITAKEMKVEYLLHWDSPLQQKESLQDLHFVQEIGPLKLWIYKVGEAKKY